MAMKQKPLRPPQPKVSNAEAEKEGMLIDLSPSDSLSINSNRQMAMSQTPSMNISLLDTPIDIPTENMDTNTATDITYETKLEPPPYQSPPTYINTLGINTQSDNNYTLNNTQQFDPFDTSFIGNETAASTSSSSGIYRYGSNITRPQTKSNTSQSIITEAITKHSNQNGAIAKPKIMTNQLDTLVMNTMASLSPRNSLKNLSTLVNTDVKSNYSMTTNNLAQWNSRSQLNASQLSNGAEVAADANTSSVTAGSSDESIVYNENVDQSLSDSLKVNLSSLTIDESINSSLNTPKKLDKAFYAELEKEIYKNESSAASLIVNTSQTYAGHGSNKENSVSTMPSEIYDRRNTSNTNTTLDTLHLNKVQNLSPRPQKYTMTKSINQEIAQNNRSHYESTSMNYNYQHNNAAAVSIKNYAHIPYQFQKQNNTDCVSATNSSAVSGSSSNTATIDTNSVINQIWFEQQNASGTTVATPSIQDSPRKQVHQIGGIHQYGNIPATEKIHNFVAISNRAPNNQQINDLTRQVNNIYSSVSGDVYGSVAGDLYSSVASDRYGSIAGDIYETVMPPAQSVYGSIPRNSAIYGNSSGITIPSMQPVLYDEVANEELLRPHRPAPVVPLMQNLSAQQIQRRLERERQQQQQLYGNLSGNSAVTTENQKVIALMREIGDEATQDDALLALQSANWDHSIAIRHFKIEQLVR